MSDEIIGKLRTLSTSSVSDAMDRLGINGQCLGIKPLDPGFRLCGRAFTMHMTPAEIPAGSVGDYIDDVKPGEVVVIDNHGREDMTVWGDILTFVAKKMGVEGTVIDGHCRDVHLALEREYPLYSRGWSMRTGKDRVQLDQVNVPVSIGGARVEPGDILLGDADGVVCLPQAKVDDILKICVQIEEAEEHIRAAIDGGMRLDEARKEFRYHQLQSREE
ncbi:MAG: RraA family protein [Rhodospirillales bacterium]|jgi:regulator of RNase E activity RraA